jgi:predicted DCC family thiol-disulfide oxidoreductase YuxK
MPFELTTFTLPGGARCLRMVTAGHFSKEDADAFVRETDPGGPMHGLPRLVLTQKQESISSDARSVFAARTEAGQEPWVAVVVTNPVIRVVTNFLMRVNRNLKVTLFTDEEPAIRWLDEQCRKEAAKRT